MDPSSLLIWRFGLVPQCRRSGWTVSTGTSAPEGRRPKPNIILVEGSLRALGFVQVFAAVSYRGWPPPVADVTCPLTDTTLSFAAISPRRSRCGSAAAHLPTNSR